MTILSQVETTIRAGIASATAIDEFFVGHTTPSKASEEIDLIVKNYVRTFLYGAFLCLSNAGILFSIS